MGAVAVAKRRERRHVRHSRAGDRIGLVLDEMLERGARPLGVAVEQLAKRAVAARVARFLPARVRAQVRLEPARTLAPLAVQHSQVRHEERRLVRPRRGGEAPPHFFVFANGLLVPVGTRKGARGVKRVFRGQRTAGPCGFREGLRGLTPAAARVKQSHSPGVGALAVARLFGPRRRARKLDGTKGVIGAARIRQNARADEKLRRGERMLRLELQDQRRRIEARRGRPVGPVDREPPGVCALFVRRRVRDAQSQGARLGLLRVRPLLAREQVLDRSPGAPAVVRSFEGARGFELSRRQSPRGEPKAGLLEWARHALRLGTPPRDVVGEKRNRGVEPQKERQSHGRLATFERDSRAHVPHLGALFVGIGQYLEGVPRGVPLLVAHERRP